MKLMMWFWLLSKRLYKKLTFLAILLLIPLLVLGYSAAAKGDSGMITVALAQREADPLAEALIQNFGDSSQLIRYEICDDAQTAEELVQRGKADMAWIFEGDLENKLMAFMAQPKEKNSLVTVVLREDDVTLRLAREKLSGALYQALSQRLYISYVRENVPELAVLCDEALMEYYNTHEIANDLFAFDETNASMVSVQSVHYLTAPVRGLLAVVIVLCGMATAMYYMQDTQRGTFSWVSTRALPAVELGCQLVSLVNVTAVVLLALALAGQFMGFGKELGVAALFCVCCACFCLLLRRLCGTVKVLGTLLPLLVVVMLVVCPVFFDFGVLRSFQYLLPPTYFVNAMYSAKYLWYMAGYSGICLGLYGLLGLAKE